MKWQDKLNKADHEHLKESHAKGQRITLETIRTNVLAQANNKFPCWKCVAIGRKLGISVELKAFNIACTE